MRLAMLAVISLFATSAQAETIFQIGLDRNYNLNKIVAKVDGTIQECGDYFRLHLEKGSSLKEKNLHFSFSITISELPRKTQMVVDNPRRKIFFKKTENFVRPFVRFLRIKEEIVTVVFLSEEERENVIPCLVYDPKKKTA